jgi:CheY-like chemotaxis protein
MLHKILIVDDSADIRGALAKRLEVDGYEVESCESGLRGIILALEGIRSNQCFDVFVLDVSMPYVDGFTAAEIIRKIESTGVTGCRGWIAAYTATEYGPALEKTSLPNTSGIDAFFMKGSDEAELILQISHWVEMKNAGTDLTNSRLSLKGTDRGRG